MPAVMPVLAIPALESRCPEAPSMIEAARYKAFDMKNPSLKNAHKKRTWNKSRSSEDCLRS